MIVHGMQDVVCLHLKELVIEINQSLIDSGFVFFVRFIFEIMINMFLFDSNVFIDLLLLVLYSIPELSSSLDSNQSNIVKRFVCSHFVIYHLQA